MMHLRLVEKKDISDIFNWRNHPSVRKMMFNSEKLEWSGHLLFWERLLADEFAINYIIEKDGQSCGVVRLTLNKNKTYGEIDIFLNPDYHGKGIGTQAVKELIEKARDIPLEKLVAQVIPENRGSERMFRKAGFDTAFTQLELTVK